MPELKNPDFSTWFETPMVQDQKDPNVSHGEPREGVLLVETLYVQNPLAKGKRRGEDWTATIEVSLPSDCILDTVAKGTGFESDRSEARARAIANLKEQLDPMIQNLVFLGVL